MSNVQEALKAAIEEIENYGKFLSAVGVLIDATKSTKAINQCKAAIAEIEKCEPVAMVNKNNPHRPYLQELSGVFKLENGTKLYTSQQPLKRLSQLDVLKILNECAKSPYTNTQSSLGFANAIMDAMQEINK